MIDPMSRGKFLTKLPSSNLWSSRTDCTGEANTEGVRHSKILVECIVGERESAHARLEARITLRYVQRLSHII